MSTPRLAVLAAALALAGCNSSSKSSGRVGVSAHAGGSAAGAASVDVGGGVSVTRVRVLVSALKLEGGMGDESMPMPMPTPMMAADDGGGEGGDGDEVTIGPLVVDVSGDALSASVTRIFDADVPDGTYDELRITVAPVTEAAAGSPVAAMGTSSIIVDGMKTPPGATSGTPFSFTSTLKASQKTETKLVVDHAGKTSNVTLVLDLDKWFTGAGGPLDPTVDANRAAIEANILASLRIERDDDENGLDDDHE